MYNNYFGFREAPFSVTPDPRFWYTNPEYQEAFATLSYGIEARKGFIVVTGEVGTGKTTLLRALMHSLGTTVHSVFVFYSHLSFLELLRFTLRELGLKGDGEKLTMIEELRDYLVGQHRRGHVVALLLDEAPEAPWVGLFRVPTNDRVKGKRYEHGKIITEKSHIGFACLAGLCVRLSVACPGSAATEG